MFEYLVVFTQLWRKWGSLSVSVSLCLVVSSLILQPTFSFGGVSWNKFSCLYVWSSSRCLLRNLCVYFSISMMSGPSFLSQGVTINSLFCFSYSKTFSWYLFKLSIGLGLFFLYMVQSYLGCFLGVLIILVINGGIDVNQRVNTLILTEYGNLPLLLENYA